MYRILSSPSPIQLGEEVNEFMLNNTNWELQGGPYSDGKYHHQCLIKK